VLLTLSYARGRPRDLLRPSHDIKGMPPQQQEQKVFDVLHVSFRLLKFLFKQISMTEHSEFCFIEVIWKFESPPDAEQSE
jgi:hypothetical protein